MEEQKTIYDKNVEHLKSWGFKSSQFSGYVSTCLIKGNHKITWFERGQTILEYVLLQQSVYTFQLPNIFEQPINEPLNRAFTAIEFLTSYNTVPELEYKNKKRMKNQNLHPNEQKEIKRLEIENSTRVLAKARKMIAYITAIAIMMFFTSILVWIWDSWDFAWRMGVTGIVLFSMCMVFYIGVMSSLEDLEDEMDKLINSDER